MVPYKNKNKAETIVVGQSDLVDGLNDVSGLLQALLKKNHVDYVELQARLWFKSSCSHTMIFIPVWF